jgi:hypothetical protein
MNYRLCTLIGIGTKIIVDYRKLDYLNKNSSDYNWWMKALQAVVYENKSVPHFPEE